ncbi:hypothetical protein F511_12960 [Dorcoceras hygrometricum]|uniref:DUF659 domain-containing protein n=1 Tax=Dorcoceras hygrometricum TaxID=472368 RepID=A0A2Z7AMY6_9LAMI|nr:hypothetical protein F511_12960 [Dorcoceras hygrometricum]
MDVVGQFGPGFKPPTQYQLREPLLKAEVERTKQLLKKHEEEWAKNGCSIMTDAWTDRKRRSILNMCVNCREGTTFLESKESSDEAHIARLIFQYVDKCVEHVGAQNVVQIVTDNATNNMVAAKLMKEKRPEIFWSSCARDIIRSGVTRFTSNFLILQSLIEKKSNLRVMFTSDLWENGKWSKINKGKSDYSIVMSMSFWNGVTPCLKIFAPLVRVLRLVDGDRKPSMGFQYGELLQAKKDIKVVMNNVESNYQPITKLVRVALMIFSLTTSTSGCERNWSAFEGVSLNYKLK